MPISTTPHFPGVSTGTPASEAVRRPSMHRAQLSISDPECPRIPRSSITFESPVGAPALGQPQGPRVAQALQDPDVGQVSAHAESKQLQPDGRDVMPVMNSSTGPWDGMSAEALTDELDKQVGTHLQHVLDDDAVVERNIIGKPKAGDEKRLEALYGRLGTGARTPASAAKPLAERREALALLQSHLNSPARGSVDDLVAVRDRLKKVRLPEEIRTPLNKLIVARRALLPAGLAGASPAKQTITITRSVKELPGLKDLLARNEAALREWASSGQPDAIMALQRFQRAKAGEGAAGDIGRLVLPLAGAPRAVRDAQAQLHREFGKAHERMTQRALDLLERRIHVISSSKERAGPAATRRADAEGRLLEVMCQWRDLLHSDARTDHELLRAKYRSNTAALASEKAIVDALGALTDYTEQLGAGVAGAGHDLPHTDMKASPPAADRAVLHRQLLNMVRMAIRDGEDGQKRESREADKIDNLPKPGVSMDPAQVRRELKDRARRKRESFARFVAYEQQLTVLTVLHRALREGGPRSRDALVSLTFTYPGQLRGDLRATLDALVAANTRGRS